MAKLYVQPNELRVDSLRLGAKIFQSGFRPDFMVALWRGGSTIGCYVHEFLKYKGLEVDHIAIRTSKYTGIDTATRSVVVHNFAYLIEKLTRDTKLLIVDDIFDTGHTMAAFFDALESKLGDKGTGTLPTTIKVATVYYKPSRNQTTRVPDYYIHETDQWVVFPHELEGLTLDEIATGMGEDVHSIVVSGYPLINLEGSQLNDFLRKDISRYNPLLDSRLGRHYLFGLIWDGLIQYSTENAVTLGSDRLCELIAHNKINTRYLIEHEKLLKMQVDWRTFYE